MLDPYENRGYWVGFPDGRRPKVTPGHGVLGNWGETDSDAAMLAG